MAVTKIRDKNGVFQSMLSIKGENGYTPIKGTDYYTPEEKAELVQEIEQTAIGDIDAALDHIIAIQNELIGGGSV